MQTRVLLAITALLAAGPLSAKPAAPAAGIAVGQILNDSLGKTVNGWAHMQGSMYRTSETKNYVTTSTLACCIAVFKRGNSYIVARTEPLTRDAKGGVIKEKVVAIKRVDARPGEVQEECSIYSLDIGLTLRNPKTRMARSVVVDEGGLSLFEWKDNEGRCGSDGL